MLRATDVCRVGGESQVIPEWVLIVLILAATFVVWRIGRWYT